MKFLKVWTILFAVAIAYFFAALIGCKSPTQLPDATPAPAVKLKWNNDVWSKYLVEQISIHFEEFDKAKDAVKFCPKYERLSKEQKSVMWAHFVVAVTKFESGYNTNSVYKESNGVDSIGLLQLSYGDKGDCPKSGFQGDLKDPLVNLKCGVSIFARMISQDLVVARGGYQKYGVPAAEGAARYWSVLRSPDAKSKHHLKEIQELSAVAPGCI
jgi:hypothetical protein